MQEISDIENVHKLKIITEEITSNDIEGTDTYFNINEVFQQASVESLARQVSSITKILSPSGGLFAIKKKVNSNDFELIRKEIGVFPNSPIKTGITQEAIYDILNIHGKDAKPIIGKLLRSIANDLENTELLSLLKTKSKDYGEITLSDSLNANTNLDEVLQKVHEIIIKINQKTFRSYEAFAILPVEVISSLYTLGKLYGFHENFKERGLFITQIASTKFYLNPDVTDTNVYVGIHDNEMESRSSLFFLPYQQQIVETTEYNTGNIVYFLINRFGITESPLHEEGNEMLYKFKIIL